MAKKKEKMVVTAEPESHEMAVVQPQQQPQVDQQLQLQQVATALQPQQPQVDQQPQQQHQIRTQVLI
jgi:hypothetical protein